MSDVETDTLDIAIVGGGISGLAAAWKIHEIAPELTVRLYEREHRVGGVLETIHHDGFLIERSADMFITDLPWAINLCHRLGIQDELLSSNPTERRAHVICRGKLIPIPSGFQIMGPTRAWPVLISPILSLKGKCRLICERFVRRRPPGASEESFSQFSIRRFGREVFERLIQPLVGGIYTADPDKLSVAAALPRFIEMEQKYGSISRGLFATKEADQDQAESDSGARYSLFVAPRLGNEQFVSTIASRLPEGVVQKETSIVGIARGEDSLWRLKRASGKEVVCRKLILAIPAHQAAELLLPFDPALARELEAIVYAGCAVVCLGIAQQQFRVPPGGFGFVVPAVENRRILAISFSSNKFRGRAPEGQYLVRVFFGGACQSEMMERSDSELIEIAIEELKELLQMTGLPTTQKIVRWPNAMPQYHVGHNARVERIENRVAEIDNLALIGNAYHGVGIPQCIHTAENAVERLLGKSSSTTVR